jgi:hypothetical protein
MGSRTKKQYQLMIKPSEDEVQVGQEEWRVMEGRSAHLTTHSWERNN